MSDKPKNKDRAYQMLGLRIVGDFGVSIAVPVVLFVLFGQWLDEKYASRPLFTILGFVLAASLSARLIYKRAKAYGEAYKNIEKQ
ncbi:MAG: AtpZ/AtpI family protein [bacterium]|nr:AtpZ/AtpI family protein [bacterium]